MTNGDSSNGQRLDELVSATDAAAAKCRDQRGTLGEPASDGDHDLDMEVSNFLESAFFADHGYAIASSLQRQDDQPNEIPLNGESLLMDTGESNDIPDWGFGGLDRAFGDVQGTVNSAVDDALCVLFQPPAGSVADAISEPSLRVVIPASALLLPQPNAHPQRQSPKSSAPTPKQTKGRKRVKDELEYLRMQVQELEDKLERLRQGSTSDGGSPSVSSLTSSLSAMETEPSDTSDVLPHSTLWERTAKRQRDAKRRAQVKNAKLKEMLEDQLQLAQSLSSVLQKREDLSWLESLDPGQSTYRQCGGATGNLTTTFDVLAVQVETLYSELAIVLFESGLTGAESDVHSAQVKTDASENLYIEVVDCNTLPFDVQTTGAAIWMLMSTASIQFDSGKFQALEVTADTIRAQLTVTLRVRRLDTSVCMSLIVKRVVEADRVVFVWCAMGETQGHVYANECVQVRESGWTILTASTDAVDDEETKRTKHEPRTIVQNVVRMVPELEMSGLSTESAEGHVGVLTDVMLGSFHQNLAMLRQIIENIIRSDAIRAKNAN